MIVVADSTPLISLMKAGQLSVLEALYGEVLIPQAVYTELTSNAKCAAESEWIRTSSFLRLVFVQDQGAARQLRSATGLDAGESEAIVCAKENQADVVLMDEAAGRETARLMGLHIQGTIGVLLRAFDQKVLTADEADAAFRKLRENRRHISESIYRYAESYIHRKNEI